MAAALSYRMMGDSAVTIITENTPVGGRSVPGHNAMGAGPGHRGES